MHQVDNKIFKIQLWDMDKSLRHLYNRNFHGYFLVFDLTDRDGFLDMQDYLRKINLHAWDNFSVILIGNKSDLLDARAISFEESHEFAKNHRMLYMECSALTGYGKEEMINIMISSINTNMR